MAETAAGQAKLDQMIASGMGRQQALTLLINAQKKAATGTPTTSAPSASQTITPSPLSQSLYVDPTPGYQPLLDYLNQQSSAAKNRYETNKANISNIFSSLSGIAAQDSARITDQFTKSIAQQQMDLQARTQAAQADQAAGDAQVAATGAERGTGPALQGSPTATATAEGIDRSNAYQTTWEALQNANQQQAQADISARGAGYGQQEVSALQQLSASLEDKLMQIGGNTAQVMSDIAKAKIAGQQNVMQANYSEQQGIIGAQAAAAQAAADAQARYQQATDVAKISANARLAVAQTNAASKASSGSGATTTTKKYASNFDGWNQKVADSTKTTGVTANDIYASIDAAAKYIKNTTKPDNLGKVATPSKQDILALWRRNHPGDPATNLVTEYVKKYY